MSRLRSSFFQEKERISSGFRVFPAGIQRISFSFFEVPQEKRDSENFSCIVQVVVRVLGNLKKRDSQEDSHKKKRSPENQIPKRNAPIKRDLYSLKENEMETNTKKSRGILIPLLQNIQNPARPKKKAPIKP